MRLNNYNTARVQNISVDTEPLVLDVFHWLRRNSERRTLCIDCILYWLRVERNSIFSSLYCIFFVELSIFNPQDAASDKQLSTKKMAMMMKNGTNRMDHILFVNLRNSFR